MITITFTSAVKNDVFYASVTQRIKDKNHSIKENAMIYLQNRLFQRQTDPFKLKKMQWSTSKIVYFDVKPTHSN